MLDVLGVRRLLDALAFETWRKIAGSVEARLSFGEDSLTDNNLWALQDAFPGAFDVYRFNQTAEKETGADWEWWIGSKRTGWVCLRIQAKRIYRRSYRELNHGGLNDGDFQYDTLINGCASRSWAHPVHVFYNGWFKGDLGGTDFWPPATLWPVCMNHASPTGCFKAHPVDFGCAIASSYRVKATHETSPLTRTVKAHLENCVPWSWLLGQPTGGPPGLDGSLERTMPVIIHEEHLMGTLLALLTFLRYDAGPLEEAHEILEGPPPSLEDAQGQGLLRERLPWYLSHDPEDTERVPAAATAIVTDLSSQRQ